MRFRQYANLAGRILLMVSFLTGWACFSSGQSVSYQDIYGADWDKALQFVEKNQHWMKESCDLFRVDYSLAVAVVFPELVRYSALRDRMEITLMKALYVHKGSEYADFSVGIFQIKPSCAETILTEVFLNGERRLSRYFNHLHHALSEREKRTVILKELEDPEAEFIYVLAIVRLLDRRLGTTAWTDPKEKVKFYAAAYNSGFNAPEARIRQFINAPLFHTGLVKPAVCYTYSAISATLYDQLKERDGKLPRF